MPVSAEKRSVFLKMATDLGRMCALDERGLLKTAGILNTLLDQGTSIWLPAGLGYIMGGPGHRIEGAVAGGLGGRLGARLLRKGALHELRGVLKQQPNTGRYRGTTDREVLRGLHGDPIFQKSPELAAMKQDFLPLLRQYEGLGSLAGGALAGLGIGKALSSQGVSQPAAYTL
ncbi:MAG: hypothetical protein DRJ03_01725 [Chloroflexi bacterium]|nr:MAG: hypothetical protein DRJ03_01725 [Chloroflexota bacterium]